MTSSSDRVTPEMLDAWEAAYRKEHAYIRRIGHDGPTVAERFLLLIAELRRAWAERDEAIEMVRESQVHEGRMRKCDEIAERLLATHEQIVEQHKARAEKAEKEWNEALRRAIGHRYASDMNEGESELLRTELERERRDSLAASARAESAEAQLAVAVEALEALGDGECNSRYGPGCDGACKRFAYKALARIEAMKKEGGR